jgi:catechol 2,3-dioxygenase-like lactoylglutathione lyase family enzyme
MAIKARITLVTLGVTDLKASTAFYERLGWRRSRTAGDESVAFFALDNVVLALSSRASLAEDAGLQNTVPGFGGFTLAINVASEAEVEGALGEAARAGARILKPGQKVFWGGFTGYFADPDGHPWEVAFNPFFPLNEQGLVVLPE